MAERTCLDCAVRFKTRGSRDQRCPDCGQKRTQQRTKQRDALRRGRSIASKTKSQVVCPMCGVAFPDRRGKERAKFCSRSCQFRALNRRVRQPRTEIPAKLVGRKSDLAWRQCVYCTDWICRPNSRKTCSTRCSRALQNRVPFSVAIDYQICNWCGVLFTRRQDTIARVAQCCGQRCSQAAARKRRKAQRKSRQRGGHQIGLAALCRRDGWRCHLCGRRVRSTMDFNHDLAPSIDHLIPLSAGGQHRWENVALAHRCCNYERQHLGAAQLLLFG
jgi:hypothetical protein